MQKHDVIAEVVKSAPPLTVTSLTLAGVSLQEWVYVLTLIWLSMQISGWLYDKWKRRKRKK